MKRVMRIYGGKPSRKVMRPMNPYANEKSAIARSTNYNDASGERFKNEDRSFRNNAGARAETQYPRRQKGGLPNVSKSL